MNKKNHITEIEYHFEIPRDRLLKSPPLVLAGFTQGISSTSKITDILLETKGKSLKSDNIGIRIRKVDRNIELTYKKYVGNENGAAKFNELTLNLTASEYKHALNHEFHNLIDLIKILKKSKRKIDDVYILLEIENKRQVFDYSNSVSKINLILENIKYKVGKSNKSDSMIEIEIKTNDNDQPNIIKFAKLIKSKYMGVEINEGKNSRGMRMLNLKHA